MWKSLERSFDLGCAVPLDDEKNDGADAKSDRDGNLDLVWPSDGVESGEDDKGDAN